jgi:hypothetical protein
LPSPRWWPPGAQNGWLFPGQKPGKPMHSSQLSRRLRSLGVPVARTRLAGLAALAHRSTVCNAAGELKTDYARYRSAHLTAVGRPGGCGPELRYAQELVVEGEDRSLARELAAIASALRGGELDLAP